MGLESIHAFVNLALHKDITSDQLYSIGLALQKQIPRWEMLSDEDREFSVGPWNADLPDYCFRCGTFIAFEVPSGRIRTYCGYCDKDQPYRTTSYSSCLFYLSVISGYPEAVLERYMLQSINHTKSQINRERKT